MRNYVKKSLYLIIFVCALLAGVCFEKIEADAFSEPSFVCEIVQASEYEQEAFSDTEPCAAVKSNTQSMRIQKSFQANARRIEIKVLSSFMCSDSDFSGGKDPIGNPMKISAGQKMPKEIMTNYIHQSDGKKRI